jgi:hypothetical protein
MSSKPRKDVERSVEAHIYMTPAQKRRLEQSAARDHRSINGQILYYVERALQQEREAS